MTRCLLTLAALTLLTTSAAGQSTSIRSSRVSEGFSFRRYSSTLGQTSELSVRLPSELGDTFRRSSVGVNGPAGFAGYPQGYIRASQATYMLQAATIPPGAAGALGHTVQVGPGMSDLMGRDPMAVTVPMLSTRQMAGLLSRAEPVGAVLASDAPVSVVAPTLGERPGVSALFGMMQETQRRRLAEEMLDMEAPARPPRPFGGIDVEADSGGASDMMLSEDVFADMLVDLAGGPQTTMVEPGIPTGRPPSGSLERLDVDPASRTSARRTATALAGDLGRSAVLTKLGGRGSDRFNRLMTQGDRLLAQGRYYRAAGRYHSAQIILEFNPLPAIGAGLAYLGAGESYRASYHLRLSVRMFPELMKVRTEIDTLLGADTVDRRLAELPALLTDDDDLDMPVLFLLTFIHANRGQLDEARTYAERLAPLVARDARLQAYANCFIAPKLTAEEPVQQ